ncbi:hypothetical protein BC937DRAFT_86173 [Endogone sp. FLAS-F59071]|nr:hypothetical protein BC937DRAFT_86173 [Endogone sp. FLAS-F59071]|eukprot:RUS20215.1 hypothetical protein BC937DRAFT_86173 [Endogone sp. FLAS-F59071]
MKFPKPYINGLMSCVTRQPLSANSEESTKWNNQKKIRVEWTKHIEWKETGLVEWPVIPCLRSHSTFRFRPSRHFLNRAPLIPRGSWLYLLPSVLRNSPFLFSGQYSTRSIRLRDALPSAGRGPARGGSVPDSIPADGRIQAVGVLDKGGHILDHGKYGDEQVWTLGEGEQMERCTLESPYTLFGISFNGVDVKGKPKWNGLANVDIVNVHFFPIRTPPLVPSSFSHSGTAPIRAFFLHFTLDFLTIEAERCAGGYLAWTYDDRAGSGAAIKNIAMTVVDFLAYILLPGACEESIGVRMRPSGSWGMWCWQWSWEQ